MSIFSVKILNFVYIILIFFGTSTKCDEATTTEEVPPPKYVIYDEAIERNFVRLIWTLFSLDIILALFIELLITLIILECFWPEFWLRKPKKKTVELKKIPEKIPEKKKSSKIDDKGMEEVKAEVEKLEKLEENRAYLPRSEKKKETVLAGKGDTKENRSCKTMTDDELWSDSSSRFAPPPKPDFHTSDQGPITITTDKVMQHQVYIDEKSEEDVKLHTVVWNRNIQVYDVGDEIVDPPTNETIGSSGESSIMTASIRKLGPKYYNFQEK